jgi:DNA-binding transcriptional LysR family regulator
MIKRQRATFSKQHSDPLDLNLRALDIFIQIAESGGMSPTARRLGLTQSAVSQVIANLEQSLGVQLFDRQVRPIKLTPSGLVLLDKARAIVTAARDAIHAVRQPTSTAVPKLNLCLVDSIAGTIGPDLIAGLQPLAAQWSVYAGLSGAHGQALLSREADIIVSPDPLEDQNGLERYEILREPFVIALPRRYSGPVDTLASLSRNLDFIRFSARSMIGRQVERHLRRLRIDAPGKLEFDTADSVLAMVSGQLGWALMTPLCAIQAQSYWPSTRFIPMPEHMIFRRIFVIAREGELGDIPKTVADIASGALACLLDVRFQQHFPWAKPHIEVAPSNRPLPRSRCLGCGGIDAGVPESTTPTTD